MTSKQIAEQINTIRVATEKASTSREAALDFLRSAGIIPEEQPTNDAARPLAGKKSK